MKPQPPSSAQKSRRTSRLDRRTIYLPAEIPTAFQTGARRFESIRPATSETQRFQHARDSYAAETTSYFPKIRESAIARDKREKQLALSKQTPQVWRESLGLPKSYLSPQIGAVSKPLSTLDHDGMAAMRFAFERRGHLDEKEFIAEMLYALNAHGMEWEQQVDLTHELGSLYRQADLHAVGFLTWEDFSSTMFKASDELLPEEDTTSQRLHCQTDALNMSAEVHGMYYFEDVDRVFLHDARNKGFRLLDASSNTIASELIAPSRGGGILDAIYSPIGRYVITASTSPVIALYDVDKLRIRQQIPTEVAQTSLAYERDSATSRLYSSCTNGQVHVWNLETLTCSYSFFSKGHEVMTDIAAIDKTSHLAASCMDGKIYVLDLHLERIGKALNGHEKGVTMLKYCAHKGYLISGGLDHCLNLWNPHVEQKIGSLKGHRHQLIGLEIIPNTSQVISADESGLIKIWDLRKFAPIRTFKREAYVKDHTLPRTLTRPMHSMCYMPSRKRIAIAHSSLFFVDLQDDEDTASSMETSKIKRSSLLCEGAEQRSSVEERSKPLVVVLNQASRSIVVLTPRELQSWAMDTGQLIHRDMISLRVDVTCVAIVEDQHSCIVGADDGTLARMMLPRGAVVLSKRLHSAEVAAVRWVSDSRKVVSSSFDGTVLISLSTNLEVLHTLNHWQGIHSMNNNVVRNESEECETIQRRPILTVSEVEQWKKLFTSADYAQTGKIATRKADEILDGALSAPNTARKPCSSRKAFAGREVITLAAFMKRVHKRLREIRRLSISGRRNGGADAVTIDVHGKLQHLVTISPFDGTFCVWKLKGGTVVATGVANKHQHDGDTIDCTQSEFTKLKAALVSQVVYLDPHPYFVLVEEGYPCQLSIWSSKAISSLFPFGHQRILSFQYSVHCQPQHSAQHFGGILPHNPREDAVICATAWIASDTNSDNLFCVGDDQGYVTIYDFDELFKGIEDIQRSPHTSPAWKSSRSEQCDADRLLPSSFLCLRSRWLVRKGGSIGAICVIRESDNSQRSLPIIAVILDSGATSFFTIEGQCVGDLFDRSGPWLLSASTSRSSTRWHVAAAQMLRETKTQRRATDMPQRRQSNVKRDWIHHAASARTSSHKDAEEHAKQRPGLSRFLAVANQL